MKAYFNLPEFYMTQSLFSNMKMLKDKHPEIWIPDSEIACIFGNFPSAIWNGGGINHSGTVTREIVQQTFDFYNYELHIPLRLTFTNPLITEEHCYDSYCNMIAECGHNGMNEILTSSPVLENYLRKKYPKYKFCRSIIGAREEPIALDPKYHIEVMRRRMNNNWDFLETIPMTERPKIEFLCTDPCPDNCPRLYTHYRDFARAQLDFSVSNPNCGCSMIEVKGDLTYHYTTGLETYISRDMIDKEYLPRGFNQFKISGRGSVLGPAFGIIYYMIKPEYHQDALAILLGPYLPTDNK